MRILVAPEYGASPLWSESGAVRAAIPIGELGVAKEIRVLLEAWDTAFQETLDHDYPPDSGFRSELEQLQWEATGVRLAIELARTADVGGVIAVRLPGWDATVVVEP